MLNSAIDSFSVPDYSSVVCGLQVTDMSSRRERASKARLTVREDALVLAQRISDICVFLSHFDAGEAQELRDEAVEIIDEALAEEFNAEDNEVDFSSPNNRRRSFRTVTNDNSDNIHVDDIQSFIVNILRHSSSPLSVQQIYDEVTNAEFKINRKSLVVTLYRMKQSDIIVSPNTGHYSVG